MANKESLPRPRLAMSRNRRMGLLQRDVYATKKNHAQLHRSFCNIYDSSGMHLSKDNSYGRTRASHASQNKNFHPSHKKSYMHEVLNVDEK